ncbi:MAG: SDR family oxidoreductase [Desulfobacteraceae bacterium]|jgi:acyl transferase domain-containing protein/NAD(P)-dependent dehydrogenase (short-subunit alcohol dehydrogenase family)/acyl carrier protein|nr:SDR family oxidoreductase [Desulfobacteraceae bacterium]
MHDNNPVAIIGMGCLFPKSTGLKEYWKLLYHGKDAITEVPASHWSPEDYFDTDPKSPDRVYCKRGGFLEPVSFDPSEFGIPPSSLEATDTSQLLGLLAAKMALEDCGYGNGRDFNRDRTAVILGVTGTQELVIPLSSRLGHPRWRKALEDSAIPPAKTEEIIQKISDSYIPWQENSFPGLLGNVVAGRISNRLDLRGTNCVVDAACASSFSAIHLATLELMSGRSDMVVTGGVDTLNDIFMHMCFSKTHTLSATGDARPFSKDADGTVLGEGIGILVLKRLKDAERDENRIYAVIKGLGSSSDGKSQSIYSPSVEGQIKALRTAYENAGINPATVGLIEAHGTGTRVGDKVEFKALNRIFKESGANGNKCALGSVKSMIGHTKASAGAAGLIKAALGLYHKVIPPTLKAETPDPDLDIGNSNFYLNSSTRPWFSKNGHSRRAGVSAFGFGGSNFHVVLEEYLPAKTEISWDGNIEIMAFSAAAKNDLIRSVKTLRDDAENGLSNDQFRIRAAESRKNFSAEHSHRLLMIHEQTVQISKLLNRALTALNFRDGQDSPDLKNIYIGGPQKAGKLALVFGGQGSQYLGMGRDLVCTFPQAMKILEDANKKFKNPTLLTELIYPPTAHTDEERLRQATSLKRTDIAQPAIGAISLAMLKIIQKFAIHPDATCGHSFGELTALCAAGWIDEQALMALSVIRGRLMAATGTNHNAPQGSMLAVQAPLAELAALIEDSGRKLVIANHNSPNQGVLSGTTAAIIDIEKICKKKKIKAVRLPVSTAFHSELVKDAARPFSDALKKVEVHPTAVKVFSNTTGEAYPTNPDEARALLGNQLARPVEFVKEIENLFKSGVRTFVEIGPKSVLTGLISTILQDRDVEAMALDASMGKAYGVADLARLLCRLGSIGYPVALAEWEKPLPSIRKSRMNVLLSGTNYREQKTENGGRGTQDSGRRAETNEGEGRRPLAPAGHRNLRPGGKVESGIIEDRTRRAQNTRLKPSKRTYENNTPMNKDDNNQSELILDALKVVSQGLQSMQNLQSETARAHRKFLESQTEANRSLQEMMKNTQRLAEKSLGVTMTPLQPAPRPHYRLEPTHDPQLDESNIADEEINPIVVPTKTEPPVDVRQTFPRPVQPEFHEGAANGYSPDTADGEPQVEESDSRQADRTEIETVMLDVVSQLTGYPTDMLGLDMDIEAELGIDSIKRVEILSALEEKMPDLPTISPEIMGSLKTLGQITEFIIESNIVPMDESRSDNLTPPQYNFVEEKISAYPDHPQDNIVATMLEVVGQLTGYPVEMLGLDMDIEAELGIDSIKRVEILSALEEKMPDLPTVSPEIMGTLKTLGQISEYLGNASKTNVRREDAGGAQVTSPFRVAEVVEHNPEASDNFDPMSPDQNSIEIPRNIVTVVTAPEASAAPLKIAANKCVFVTEDNTGLSGNIIEELASLGINAVKIKQDGLIPEDQLCHAAGLIIIQDPDSHQMEQDLKNAFALTQQLAPILLDAADGGGALFATVSRMGGIFGFKHKEIIYPVQGGLAGLAKTASVEWENVCCHAIDIAANRSDHREIASAVAREVLTPGPVEIGLDAGHRYTLTLESKPYAAGRINLDSNDVVIISGGARGVTSAAALALAKHTGSCLVLLGRSPGPTTEPSWLSSLEDEAAMKKAILENAFKNKTASPADLEKVYKSHMINREISRNLAALKSTGATVHYYSVDLRNSKAVHTCVDAIRLDHGPITGIIHGAGVLEDRLIIDKTPDQFERVFDTKVKGLKNLLEATREDSLKYLVVFSSVAARFGNKGQVDYAMANEVLNKIAQAESFARDDCRVIAINWGPWDGGMVTPALKREFERKGIHLIPPDAGARCLLHEMMMGKNATVEVVIGAEIKDRNESKRPALVKSPAVIKKSPLTLCFERDVDISQYPVLNAHIIDDKPVVPLALMMEWFAHGALHPNPGLIMHGLDDIQVLKGIRLEHEKHQIRLFADKLRKNDGHYEVAVELRGGNDIGQDVIHSRAKAILGDHLVSPPLYQFSKLMIAGTYNKNIQDIYDEILFHGFELRGIRKIVSCSTRGMVARLSAAPGPRQWMSSPLRDRWIADPLVLDSAFQMAIVWCYEEKRTVSLPSSVTSYRQYRHQFPTEGVTAVLEVSEIADHKMRGDFTFSDSNGEIVARLTGYQAIVDASLLKAFKPRYSALA